MQISQPINWKQWVVIVVVLLVVIFIGLPELYDVYVLRVAGPYFEKELGFKTVVCTIPNSRYDSNFYVSEVIKGGAFDNAGVKPGFIPTGYGPGGGGALAFYYDLLYARGGKAELRFLEVTSSGEEITHRIEVAVPK